MKMLKYPDGGGKPEILDIPAGEKAKAEELHNALIEEAAESDESLMEAFFEKGYTYRRTTRKRIESRYYQPWIIPGFLHFCKTK